MLLTGKSALITGAANRLGAQIARTLHQNGANLIIHYRRSDSAAASLADELNAARADSAITLGADLAGSAGKSFDCGDVGQVGAERYGGVGTCRVEFVRE